MMVLMKVIKRHIAAAGHRVGAKRIQSESHITSEALFENCVCNDQLIFLICSRAVQYLKELTSEETDRDRICDVSFSDNHDSM